MLIAAFLLHKYTRDRKGSKSYTFLRETVTDHFLLRLMHGAVDFVGATVSQVLPQAFFYVLIEFLACQRRRKQ